MAGADRELLKGSLDVVLLAVLARGPHYGYQIIKEVRASSEGALDLAEGTLYPALHRLEQAGLLEGFWQSRPDGADRRYYRLTPAGVAAAEERRAAWQRFAAGVAGVLRYA